MIKVKKITTRNLRLMVSNTLQLATPGCCCENERCCCSE